MTNGQRRSPGKDAGGADKALAAALKDAGCSYASLAHRVNELHRRQGVVVLRAGARPADRIALVLEHTEHELRVTLSGRSPLLPRPSTPGTTAESGRGRSVVAAFVDDWGTAPPDPGTPAKKVWFSLVTGGKA
ncbi:ATP-binding protein [Streptomyces sp. ADMS]|uniref:ATP-binding protein n=1 Tax=Streptomyces sp. ADMS TaxID=3071415 RepID=UPI00296EF8FA|nr:ATP-binding protein [Streptomyces sp. ADMS]MDW4905290.1 ATP-binding protein [Streptomyces sp. ADMS]